MRVTGSMATVLALGLAGCGGGGGASGFSTPMPAPAPVVVAPYTKNLASSYEASRTAIWVSEPEGPCLAVGYADFDHDSREDYVCGTVTGTTASAPIKIYSRGASGETWTDVTTKVFSGAPMETVHARKVVVADFNGDGKPDLLVADHGYDQSPFPGAPLRLALSQADGSLKVVDAPYPVVGFYHAAAAADINGDGFVDIVATDNFHGGAVILLNDGKGHFTAAPERLPVSFQSGYHQSFTVELVDVDGDGAADMLIGGHDDKSAGTMPPTIFWNDGKGNFSDAASLVLPQPTGYGVTLDFDVADLDGDGKKEIVMNHTTLSPAFYQGFRWSVVTMNGRTATDVSNKWFGTVFDDGLGRCSTSCTAQNNWTKWLRLVDHDGDGKPDLLVSDQSRNLWFRNTGSAFVRQ